MCISLTDYENLGIDKVTYVLLLASAPEIPIWFKKDTYKDWWPNNEETSTALTLTQKHQLIIDREKAWRKFWVYKVILES